MATDQAQSAKQTLSLLEERLDKLQLLLHGDGAADEARDTSYPSSVTTRLQSLDKALRKLESESSSIKELLRLHKSQRRAFDHEAESNINLGDESVAATLVLSHAAQLNTTTSNLRSIHDAAIPEASSSVHIIAQTPRMQRALVRTEAQNKHLSDLRTRSAELVSRWHQVGVLGVGEVISEWDERLTDAERSIRQQCARRKREVELT
ncbi:hypothetical protein BDZ85DRAFT_260592 [Elsinoe ampelina]|uniref:Uncharacterized protein n=1 Tax=Elsinoe ampelina TaxID=302913 RepID=A0A6A6GFL2_9PEZI|nr:hypothetical protein BDZ85DRAFT_260592 [Elsinoe ampelina]